jgi:hypothetical protein
MRHGLKTGVVAYLANIAANQEEFKSAVDALLQTIDDPVAMRFVLTRVADIEHRAKESGRDTLLFIWESQFQTRLEDRGGMSEAALAEVQSLWQSDSHPERIRTYAFKWWVRFSKDLTIAEMLPETISSCPSSIWERARKGDLRVSQDVVARLESQPNWLHLVPRIWCSELEAAVERLLHATAESVIEGQPPIHAYRLAEVLRDIPVGDAERLLLKYWPKLAPSQPFVEVALYLGSDDCRRLAAEAINGSGLGANSLANIHGFFGFGITGLVDRLSMRHLESLLPYLRFLSDFCIYHMARFCFQRGDSEWAKRHLGPECRRRAEKAQEGRGEKSNMIESIIHEWFPRDSDLLRELDSIEATDDTHHVGSVWMWLERFDRRGDPPDRAFRILESWLMQAPSTVRYNIAARAIRYRGTRRTLEILVPFRPIFDALPSGSLFEDIAYAVKRRSLS